MNPLQTWRQLSRKTRTRVLNVVKAVVTVGGFWALLGHEVSTWNRVPDGEVWFAPVEHAIAEVDYAGSPLVAVASRADLDGLPQGQRGYFLDEPNGLLYVDLAGASPDKSLKVPAEPEIGRMRIGHAILDYTDKVDAKAFVMWSLVAMFVKFIGVISSCYGWQLLLRGQGIRFPFWQQAMTSFLIGRFIGTFLPSSLGLDAYTLWEAGRYSNQWHRAVTAKALEKFIGLAGLFTGLLLTLPAGYIVLSEVVGAKAPLLTALIGALSALITGAVVIGLVWPVIPKMAMTTFGSLLPGMVRRHVERFTDAVTAYQGQTGLLLGALLAKFVTHFTTAMVYFFTALAIGVTGVQFLPVVFGSLIQILGTLFSPTIAGEGAREAIQALLLSSHLGGAAQAVLSAALGFAAAEAATLWGGAFLWVRRPGWRPTFVTVDGQQVDYAWINDDEDTGFSADSVKIPVA